MHVALGTPFYIAQMSRILVTGSSGGLGSSVVDELLASDGAAPTCVVMFDVIPPPRRVLDPRVVVVPGDIRMQQSIEQALRSNRIDTVIHCAAVVDWVSSTPRIVHEVNVVGTQNVINACRNYDVKCLVATSSIDAITSNLEDIDESLPYPRESPNGYCKSKQLAEIAVLEANSATLRTAVIRPAAIWGPQCRHGLCELVELARSGFYATLGDGSAVCQHVFVRNCAHAHVLLARALARDDDTRVRGRVYLITDAPPMNYFMHLERVMRGADIRMWPALRLPAALCLLLATIVEFVYDMLPFLFAIRPSLSRFAVLYTCRRITYTSDRARRDFAFVPKYTQEQALIETIEFCKSLR